jgi:hypothetical protein
VLDTLTRPLLVNNKNMGNEHKGWFSDPMSGSDSLGNPLSVSFGEGANEGHTLLADGTDGLGDSSSPNPKACDFMNHQGHNHYGPGDGQNSNVFDRGKYSGPGA